jgi:cytochrome c oxidase subunit 2
MTCMKRRTAPIFPAILSVAPLLFTATTFADSPNSAAEREFAAVLRLKPDAVHGEQIFDTCAACHGDNGHGASDGSVPAIAGQNFRVIVRELVMFRHGGRSDPRMQHFTDRTHLTRGAQDIADVAAYVSQLQPSASTSNTSVNR